MRNTRILMMLLRPIPMVLCKLRDDGAVAVFDCGCLNIAAEKLYHYNDARIIYNIESDIV